MVILGDNQYKKTNYHYSSGDKSGFSVWSRKGFEDVLEQFEKYKTRHPDDSLLYRNFTKEYWKVWRWRDYLLNEQYQLPFKDAPPDARKLSRGREVRPVKYVVLSTLYDLVIAEVVQYRFF